MPLRARCRSRGGGHSRRQGRARRPARIADGSRGRNVDSSVGITGQRGEPVKHLQPHPEERRIFAARLEGWQRVRAVHLSFETAAHPSTSAQEGGLLRMRSELFYALIYGFACYLPRIAEAMARGSRAGHLPNSTAWKKSSRCPLYASGSSRLIVWPQFGITTRPALEIVLFIRMAGSRQAQSSSPVMIKVGVVIFFISSVRSYREGRRLCTPRIVRAEPLPECPAS